MAASEWCSLHILQPKHLKQHQDMKNFLLRYLRVCPSLTFIPQILHGLISECHRFDIDSFEETRAAHFADLIRISLLQEKQGIMGYRLDWQTASQLASNSCMPLPSFSPTTWQFLSKFCSLMTWIIVSRRSTLDGSPIHVLKIRPPWNSSQASKWKQTPLFRRRDFAWSHQAFWLLKILSSYFFFCRFFFLLLYQQIFHLPRAKL